MEAGNGYHVAPAKRTPMSRLPAIFRAARSVEALRPDARRFAAKAWLGAPVVEASLRLLGLRRTLGWIEALPEGVGGTATVDVVEGERLVQAVYRWHLVTGECLPQALLQHLVHHLDGVPSRFVVGVARTGESRALAAHAWTSGERARESGFAPLFASGGPAA
jgi:hypothetical protein